VSFYLGIDAGGSHTECALADGCTVLARVNGQSCKPQRVGYEQATLVLSGVVSECLATAKVARERIAAACIGISGASDPQVAAWAKATLTGVAGGMISVVGDHLIALEAAFPGTSGVVVISGTGSIAVGRNESGEISRSGGHGPNTSDEGSATWIVRHALQAAPPTSSLNTLQLTGDAYADSQLFPKVLAAAEAGDAAALAALDAAGAALARHVANVIKARWAHNPRVTVRSSGSVLVHSPRIRASLRKHLLAEWPSLTYDESPLDPIQGALYLARIAHEQSGKLAQEGC